MPELLSPTTELDAVNTMLDVIGESPVSTIEDNGLVDAALARDLLRKVSREVQSRGWYWNTDRAVELAPGNPLPAPIAIPANALQVEPVDVLVQAVPRGAQLWDIGNNTFNFSASVRCDIIRLLPFEDIPEAARGFIMVRAARVFQDRRIGSTDANGFNKADEVQALVTLQSAEARQANFNLANGRGVGRALNPWAPLAVRR